MASFQAFFEDHAAASLEKQLALADLIGEAGWQLDLALGTISFGATLSFPVQILGSESQYSNTWLWAWANTQSNLPAAQVQAARRIRDLGLREHIDEFTEASVSLEQLTGHQIALVATGIIGADAYYRGPYAGGAIFVLLEAPIVRQHVDGSTLHLIKVFNQLISLFPMDHRRALKAYLRHRRYTPVETAVGIEAVGVDGAVIRASFDSHGRLVKLTTSTGHPH